MPSMLADEQQLLAADNLRRFHRTIGDLDRCTHRAASLREVRQAWFIENYPGIESQRECGAQVFQVCPLRQVPGVRRHPG